MAASKTVTLYNKSNKLLFTTQSYKNTGETFSQTDEGIVLLQYDVWTRAERLSIVNAAFSASEKQKEKVWYIPTEEGKKLNYIYYWWAQEPQ